MSRNVEIYNTYFGDCIILKDSIENSNLLIDFGIHYFSDVPSAYGNRDLLTDKIAEDIATRYSNGNISLLITHFHEDHISGLIKMYQSGDRKYKSLFKNIYIANIWKNPFAIASNLLEEMIIEKELKNTGLPRTTASLFDIIDFLYGNVYSIYFLERGTRFENNKYVTLWPIIDKSDNAILEIVSSLELTGEFVGGLMALSEMIGIFVLQELFDENGHSRYEQENYVWKQRIDDFKAIYNELYTVIDENDLFFGNDSYNHQKEELNKLNHKYNIVFQNLIDEEDNVLFTGDVEVSQMNEIAMKTDIALHKKYKYVKIPHHGTERHYFDYSRYNPQNILITNGKLNLSNANSYKISKRYGAMNSFYVCTNSNNCLNCNLSCATATSICKTNHKLVYSNLYETI